MTDEKKEPAKEVRKEDIRPTNAGGQQILSGPLPGAAGSVAPSVQPGELVISGTAGGPFNIRGARFDQIGKVTFGGREVTVTKWENNVIKGTLPADIEKGEVVVTDGTGKVQKGHFGAPAAAPGREVDVIVTGKEVPRK
jgi:hypothetical protein